MDVLPNETVYGILREVTDATDISSIVNTNQRLRSLGQQCFTRILTSTKPVVRMNLVLQLPKLAPEMGASLRHPGPRPHFFSFQARFSNGLSIIHS